MLYKIVGIPSMVLIVSRVYGNSKKKKENSKDLRTTVDKHEIVPQCINVISNIFTRLFQNEYITVIENFDKTLCDT